MAPRKSVPQSISMVRASHGITFSFSVTTPVSPDRNGQKSSSPQHINTNAAKTKDPFGLISPPWSSYSDKNASLALASPALSTVASAIAGNQDLGSPPVTPSPSSANYDLSVKVHQITSPILLSRMSLSYQQPSPIGKSSFFSESEQEPTSPISFSRKRSFSTNHEVHRANGPLSASQRKRAKTFHSLVRHAVNLQRSSRHVRSDSNSSLDSFLSQDSFLDFYTPRKNANHSAFPTPQPLSSLDASPTKSHSPRSSPTAKRQRQQAESQAKSDIISIKITSPAKVRKPSTAGSAASVSAGGANKKRKITHTTSTAGECTWCGTKKTAQWRKGPTGSRALCNACGLEWAKEIRIEAGKLGVSNNEAEQSLMKTYLHSERFQRYMREHVLANGSREESVSASADGTSD